MREWEGGGVGGGGRRGHGWVRKEGAAVGERKVMKVGDYLLDRETASRG